MPYQPDVPKRSNFNADLEGSPPPPRHCRALFEVEAGDLVHDLQLHLVQDGLTRPDELQPTHR